VKFGPFLDQTARVLSYQATPPSAEFGTKAFQGLVSVDGIDSAVGGYATILPPQLHPADRNPADFRITINETTAYASAWRKGQPWEIGPNPIPVDYVTRAGLLWKKGESYRFDATNGAPPLWWTSSLPSSQQQTIASKSITLIETSTALASLPSVYVPDEPFKLTLTVVPASDISVYAVEVRIPIGLAISSLSDAGQQDRDGNTIRWGPFFDNQTRALTLVAVAPSASASPLRFSGEASFDGNAMAIEGATTINPSVRLTSFQLLPDQRLAISIRDKDGTQWQIQQSEDLKNWQPISMAILQQGSLTFTNPNPAALSFRFYRAQKVVP
jgi:hypothetical protein